MGEWICRCEGTEGHHREDETAAIYHKHNSWEMRNRGGNGYWISYLFMQEINAIKCKSSDQRENQWNNGWRKSKTKVNNETKNSECINHRLY